MTTKPRRPQTAPVPAVATPSSAPLPAEVLPSSAAVPVAPPPPSDDRVVALWLHGRPPSTVKTYLEALKDFHDGIGGKPLARVTLEDLQAHDRALTGLAPATRAKRLAAIKSLFSFACKTGYLPLDPGRALKLPKRPDHLAERILDEATIAAIIAGEPMPLRRLLLRLFYASGGRISEVVNLRWQDCHAKGDSGVVTFTNAKGGIARTVKLQASVWRALMGFLPPSGSGFVFPSPRRDDQPIDPATAWRWVKAAARRIGMELASPHWFRHAHASHALDRGAPVHLVAATLGHKSLATTTRYAHARPSESSGDYLALGDDD
jgi:integrase/recombinase XerD